MYSNIESILGNSVYDTVIYGFVLRAYPKKQKRKQKIEIRSILENDQKK